MITEYIYIPLLVCDKLTMLVMDMEVLVFNFVFTNVKMMTIITLI